MEDWECIKKSDIITVPYFCHEVIAWNSYLNMDILEEGDPCDLLERLEEGGNIFNVVPSLSKDLKFKLDYAYFANREGVSTFGRMWDSREYPKQVGKLLIPHYNVLSRDDMTLRFEETRFSSAGDLYKRVLSENPDTDTFYLFSSNWAPLDLEKVFVLKKEQLS